MGELVGVATGHPLLALVLLGTAVCGVLHAWISHRTAIRHEAEATKRVQLAVGGTSSPERAAVVRACAELEAASHSRRHLRLSSGATYLITGSADCRELDESDVNQAPQRR